MTRRTRKRPPRVLDTYTFKSQVRNWATTIGVMPKEIHVRTMSTKWASCSTAGRVTFSSDLLRASSEWRAYVIVHELLHLQVPNHGKLFKALLSGYVPDWERIVERQQRRKPASLGLSQEQNDVRFRRREFVA